MHVTCIVVWLSELRLLLAYHLNQCQLRLKLAKPHEELGGQS